jgi:signal transduction histidine kinase
MCVHFGLFLFWQPLWNRSRSVSVLRGGLVLLILLGVLMLFPHLFLMLWLSGVTGLIGSGNCKGWERGLQLFLLAWCLAMMLLGCVPLLFSIELDFYGSLPVYKGILTLFPLVLVLPNAPHPPGETRRSDTLRGLISSLLVLVLGLGVALWSQQPETTYADALLLTLLLCGFLLFVLATLMGIYGGWSVIWSRWIMGVDSPIEDFLLVLTQKAQEKNQADVFLCEAMRQLLDIDWVMGIKWNSAVGAGELGDTAHRRSEWVCHDLRVTIYTRLQMNMSMVMYIKLLVNLIALFSVSKQREQKLSQKAHLEAIFETGARLTHDIKNVLQSLKMLISGIEMAEPGRADEVLTMVKRQLPALTERLQLTLEKLSAPENQSVTRSNAEQWWQQLQDRNWGRQIEFVMASGTQGMLPLEVFDTVADNLLDNARMKRMWENPVEIVITLFLEGDRVCLKVKDTGSSVKPDIARYLFKEAVASETGLGIGLLQSARQAEEQGYQLVLESNVPGNVVFLLK